jgi:hypothetical protein
MLVVITSSHNDGVSDGVTTTTAAAATSRVSRGPVAVGIADEGAVLAPQPHGRRHRSALAAAQHNTRHG